MKETRAREIASSPVMVNVTYHGTPIYIENVEHNAARIHPLTQPQMAQIVHPADLVEHR